MLTRQPERRMRAIRTGLLVAWFVLIASLFYDPLTPLLTHPANVASPFHLGDRIVKVQGVALPKVPYAMGNRIFWTMVLPLLPVFLMLFGHETWRRVCPLSHFSQIPRMLGWQRQTPRLNRRTGAVDHALALIPHESWMRRNYLLFQFGFLVCGLMGRILFYNADRLALVGIFSFILGFSFVIGLLYGGKTWCNYYCPIGVIHNIYVGPGGLLDSKAVNATSPITQSMCRTSSDAGDKSSCVGCTSNCADIDVENSYWKNIDSDVKRFVYYGFFGLTLAFYTYYFAYSGGSTYYFTGDGPHETDQLAKLFSPGFFISGRPIPIPKVLAVPLHFGICILGAYALFCALEAMYARAAVVRGRPLGKVMLRHRMLTIVAFLTFNLFYIFAGRPNLLLLPDWVVRLVDIALVLISTTWLWRSLARTAEAYRRESLAKSLREQLRRMGFRSEDVLEGRPLSGLSADEVYVLAKTLPGFSASQKREAYRAILAEVLETGETRSWESLRLLADLRAHLDLSDADHAAITEALGISDPQLLDPDQARSVEVKIRLENYRAYLYDVLTSQMPAGMKPRVFLASHPVAAAVRPFRLMYGITDDEHDRIVADIAKDGSTIADWARKLVAAICENETQRFSLAFDLRPEARLICHALILRQRGLLRETVNLIASLDDAAIARSLAQSIYALMGKAAVRIVNEAAAGMPADTLKAFLQQTADAAAFSYLDVVAHHKAADDVLAELAADKDPLVAVLAASALGHASALGAMPDGTTMDIGGLPSSWLIEKILASAGEGQHAEKIETMASLLSVDAFSQMELATLADIARHSRLVAFNPGDMICRDGDVSDCIFVLVSGETRAWIEMDGQQVTFGTGRPGAVFGELGVITGRPRSASVEAAGDLPTTLIAIPREIVELLLSRDLTATRSMLDVVSGYLLERTLAMSQRPAPVAAGPAS